jgi:hypothetical protein
MVRSSSVPNAGAFAMYGGMEGMEQGWNKDGTRMEQGWNKDGTRMEQGWKDGFNSEQDVNTMDRFDSRICAVVQTCSEPSSPRPILLTGHFSASYEYSKLKEIALCAAFARSTLESRRLDRLT